MKKLCTASTIKIDSWSLSQLISYNIHTGDTYCRVYHQLGRKCRPPGYTESISGPGYIISVSTATPRLFSCSFCYLSVDMLHGDPGIPLNIRQNLKYIFWMLAKSDNKHDFGSTLMKEMFDAIPLESTQTFKNRLVTVAKLRIENRDKSIYDFFKDDIYKIFSDTNLYAAPSAPPPGVKDVINEIETINYITGLNMNEIKNTLRNSGEYNYFKDIGKIERNLNNVVSRNYTIAAVRYKKNHKRSCLSKAIKTLIGGKERITLIIDASNLKMTEIRSNSEEGFEDPPPPVPIPEDSLRRYENFSGSAEELAVNLLFSSENKSDSAGKIGYESYSKGENEEVKISVFEDIQETLSYPVFSGTDPSQNANIYASIPFTTHRVGDQTVRGEFIIKESEDKEIKVVIDDLKNESQIASASFKAVQLYLEAYGRADVDDIKMKEILIQFLIKRIGDWAQGLCLLDLYRIYKLMKGEGILEKEDTLETIKGDGEMGVLTHDQVLLSYSMLIGVDVFFTIHFPTGDHWLLHFKNAAAGGKTTSEKKDQEIKGLTAVEDSLNAEIEQTIQFIQSENKRISDLPRGSILSFNNYINTLYTTSMNLQTITIPEKLQELVDTLAKTRTRIESIDVTTDEMGQKKILSSSILRNSIRGVLEQNEKIRGVSEMGGKEKDSLDNLINAIKRGGNITVTIAYQNYMEKLVYPIRDAIKAIRIEYPSGATLDQGSFGIVGGRVAYITDNLKNLKKTLDIMVGGQSGGGRKTLKDIFYDTRDRSIIVLKGREPVSVEGISNLLPDLKDLPNLDRVLKEVRDEKRDFTEKFKAIQGEYVSDRNMNFYSVLDRYLVTEDDRHKFQYLEEIRAPEKYEFRYCTLRLLLLDHDKLYTEYIRLKPDYQVLKHELITELNKLNYSLEEKKALLSTLIKENDLYQKIEAFEEETAILEKRCKALFSGSVRANLMAVTSPVKTRQEILFSDKRIKNIRYMIFKSYMTTKGKSPYSYQILDDVERVEASDILLTLREGDPLKTDYEEFKKLDADEQAAIQELADLAVVKGGRRKTRRAKKVVHKRRTRRHTKR